MPPAVDAVMVKMPAPITTDTPKTIRSHQVRSLRNRVPGSSVSSIDCSTDLVRRPSDTRIHTPYPFVTPPEARSAPDEYPLPSAPMGRNGNHAVVIGASIAGMCAARVLSDFYDRVTVYERDELPAEPANRAAVPQGRHVHLLMARGAAGTRVAFSRVCSTTWSPRACRSWRTGRTASTSARPDTSWGRRASCSDEFTAYVPSRPHLEWQIRRRATGDPQRGHRARRGRRAELRRAARQRVTGVRPGHRRARCLPTSSSTPRAAAPGCRFGCSSGDLTDLPRHSVDVGISYATHQLRIPDGLITEKVVVAGASREQPRGLGMLCYEDGTWGLTTFGVAKVEPPQDFAEMCALADEMVPAAHRRRDPQGRADR